MKVSEQIKLFKAALEEQNSDKDELTQKDAEQILNTLQNRFNSVEYLASEFEAKTAKLNPKAEDRNRGDVCVPAERAKDNKDHFPINNIAQARNALARVHQYNSVPDWYGGSLSGLQALVARKVKAKYPSIDKE